MRHRLKFSQNSYVRMRSWEQRGKTNGKRKRDLGQDAQREGAGGWEGEAWSKTPGGKQRVRGIRGQRDTGEGREEKYQRDREPAEEAGRDPQTPPRHRDTPQDGLLCREAGVLGAHRPPALRLFPRGQQRSGCTSRGLSPGVRMGAICRTEPPAPPSAPGTRAC